MNRTPGAGHFARESPLSRAAGRLVLHLPDGAKYPEPYRNPAHIAVLAHGIGAFRDTDRGFIAVLVDQQEYGSAIQEVVRDRQSRVCRHRS